MSLIYRSKKKVEPSRKWLLIFFLLLFSISIISGSIIIYARSNTNNIFVSFLYLSFIILAFIISPLLYFRTRPMILEIYDDYIIFIYPKLVPNRNVKLMLKKKSIISICEWKGEIYFLNTYRYNIGYSLSPLIPGHQNERNKIVNHLLDLGYAREKEDRLIGYLRTSKSVNEFNVGKVSRELYQASQVKMG